MVFKLWSHCQYKVPNQSAEQKDLNKLFTVVNEKFRLRVGSNTLCNPFIYQILQIYQSSMIKRNIGFFAQLCKGPFVDNGTKFKMPIEIKPPVICAINLLKTSAFVLELMKFTIFILLNKYKNQKLALRNTPQKTYMCTERKKNLHFI